MKTCSRCGVFPFSVRAMSPDGLGPACEICAARDKKAQLKVNFGITPAEYNEMLASQGGVCAICEKPEAAARGDRTIDLSVDHCHTSKRVRQLLCSACNKALGYFRDDPELMRRAARYIEKHQREALSPPS